MSRINVFIILCILLLGCSNYKLTYSKNLSLEINILDSIVNYYDNDTLQLHIEIINKNDTSVNIDTHFPFFL